MPKRRKLPHGYPTPPYLTPRGPKRVCEHCGGTTRAVKGQKLDDAVAIHLASCPGVYLINPKRKKDNQ